MESPDTKLPTYRFGLFELDTSAGVLRRQGQRVKIQEQPLRLLVALLERPGEIVSRESLKQRLWPENTFVEFDQSFGTAITKLRQALGDVAENPRFIETVPRRGYRFIAPVTLSEKAALEAESPANGHPPAAKEAFLPATVQIPAASPDAPPRKSLRRTWAWMALGAILLAVGFATYMYESRGSFALTEKDTVVLADFQNTTGDPVFDDALRQGLIVAFGQSPLIQVLPDRKADLILKQMNHSPDAKVTGKTAVELCQRSDSKVVVEGSISNLGAGYLVGLAGVRCDTGEAIFHEEIPARSKEYVISALGEAATHIRSRLGESLASIKQHGAPLEQATTNSLDALKSYSLALAVWDNQGDEASLPYFQKAIELDSNFGMAYAALGTIYHNQNESDLARVNTSRAYELRDRLTDGERMSIEARYYRYVTGEQEKAAEVYLRWIRDHPNSAGTLINLAGVYSSLGRYDKVVEYDRDSLRVDPKRANTYAGLASALMALNQLEDAGSILAEAETRGFRTDYLLQVNYWHAFLKKDNATMQQLVARSKEIPDAEPLLLFEESNTAAYGGQFKKAHQLTLEAAALTEKSGDNETAATFWAEAALREAEVGNSKESRESISNARKLSQDPEVLVLIALAYGRLGDATQTLTLIQKLDKENPSDTLIQKYWLPSIRAALAMQKREWVKARQALSVSGDLEYGGSQGALTVNSLYPAYLNGHAYAGEGDGLRAVAEFQKLIDHPGMVLNFPLGSLAYLGRARSLAHAGDFTNARQDYQEFLKLWQDADLDTPILKQAKVEYAKVR